MKKVTVYTKDYCPYCKRATGLLKRKKVDFTEIDVTYQDNGFEDIKKQTESTTVPQIFIEDEFIGGWDDMNALNESGDLDKKLGL